MSTGGNAIKDFPPDAVCGVARGVGIQYGVVRRVKDQLLPMVSQKTKAIGSLGALRPYLITIRLVDRPVGDNLLLRCVAQILPKAGIPTSLFEQPDTQA
jgi:hypothetical protein